MIQGMPTNLVDVIDWYCTHVMGKGLRCLCLISSLAATVYGLWRERNCRMIFQGAAKGHDQVIKGIEADVRDFLCSRRSMKQSTKNRSLCVQYYSLYSFQF